MTDVSLSHAVATGINMLVGIFGLHAAIALHRARRDGVAGSTISLGLGVWLALACLIALLPPAIQFREQNPLSQPAIVLSLVILATGLLFVSSVRHYFEAIETGSLLPVFLWRAIFGCLLLLLMSQGGLPRPFAIAAGLGDIAIGLWAAYLIRRFAVGSPPSRTHLMFWNTLGMVDLLNVMRMATLELGPWLAEHPEVTRIVMLPLFGVPLFIALHIHLYRTFWREHRMPARLCVGS